MLECDGAEEALKILYEVNFGGGLQISSAVDFERLIDVENVALNTFLRSYGMDENIAKFFLLKNDYHNAEAFIKCKHLKLEPTDMVIENGLIDAKILKEKIYSDSYSGLSGFMAKALIKCDQDFASGKATGQTVNATLVKAYYDELANSAKKSKLATLVAYHKYDVDTVNLLTLYRSKKAGLDKSTYEEMVVEGGTVSKQTLQKVWDTTESSKVYDLVGNTYKKFVAVLLAGYEAGTLAKAEEFANARKHTMLTENPDTLTIAPLIAYFKNKTDEIDKIRFAFIGIKNDVDKETIKERLK